MRLSILPPSVLLHIFTSITPVRSLELDFSAYPASTQTCLEDAAGVSGCVGETVAEENQCLCGNEGNFVINTAMCIATQGSTVLTEVWDLLQDSCSETKTPLEVSEADFFEAGSTETTVISTITTTIAGTLTTYTTTSTRTNSAAAATTTTTAPSSSDTDDSASDVLASARVGAIAASVTGTLGIVCFVALIILLKKHQKDKQLLRQAQEAARAGDRYRGPDKPLLNAGSTTPGFTSPGYPPQGGHLLAPGNITPGLTSPGYLEPGRQLGASVVPPTPSYAGPISPQNWPSGHTQPTHGDRTVPSHQAHWPSPDLSQGVNTGTIGPWCPSPLSATAGPSSNVLGMYINGGAGTIGGASTMGGIDSAIGSPLARQMTVQTTNTRSSWAHDRPENELYEMPGNEHREPVEADSTPVTRTPDRLSMTTSPAPPEYQQGQWNDPITDKPPSGWI